MRAGEAHLPGTIGVGGNFSQTGGNAAAFNAGAASALNLVPVRQRRDGDAVDGEIRRTRSSAIWPSSNFRPALTATTGFITNNLTLTTGALPQRYARRDDQRHAHRSAGAHWAAGALSPSQRARRPVSGTTPVINGSVTFSGAGQLGGNLTINGTVGINSLAGNLLINGHSLTVNGDFQTANSGSLSMNNAADVVTINGNATFAGNPGLMANGVLIITGNLTQNTTTNAFNVGAAHITRFTGATPTISFANPTTSNFGSLQLETTGAVTFATDALVSFELWLKTGTTPSVTGSGHTVTIGHALYDSSTAGNRWQVTNTVMIGSGTVPRRITSNVTFSGGGILVDSAIVTGNVLVTTNTLGMNGHYMKVTGTFGTVGQRRTADAAPERLARRVLGNASFNGGNETGQLNSGYFEFDGATFVQGTASTSFAADAPHVTWFGGTTQQTVAFANPAAGSSHFGNLYLQDTATVLSSDVFLNGQLQTGGQGVVPRPCRGTAAGDLQRRQPAQRAVRQRALEDRGHQRQRTLPVDRQRHLPEHRSDDAAAVRLRVFDHDESRPGGIHVPARFRRVAARTSRSWARIRSRCPAFRRSRRAASYQA